MKIIIEGEEERGIPLADLKYGSTFRFLNSNTERSTPKHVNNEDIFLWARKIINGQCGGRCGLINLTHGVLTNTMVGRTRINLWRVEPVECELHVKADWK